MAAVEASIVEITSVHIQVLKDKPLHEALALLVKNPERLPLTADGTVDITEDISAADLRSQFGYSKACDHFEAFTTAAGIESFAIPTPILVSSEPLVMSNLALAMYLVSKTRDVAVLASTLHMCLLRPIAENATISDASLFGFITHCVRLLGILAVDLDAATNSAEALKMESTGLQMALSVATVRQWQELMRIYVGRCMKALVDEYMKTLLQATLHCQRATPTIDACINGDMFNLDLAKKLVTGKLAAIVTSHNGVHKMLLTLNRCSKILDLRPRLQDNEWSSTTVAIALAAMDASSLSSVVAIGIEVLTFTADSSGPSRARDFLLKHDTPKNARLPREFWLPLEELSSLSASSSAQRRPSSHKAPTPAAPIAKAPSEASTSARVQMKRPPSEGGSQAPGDDAASSIGVAPVGAPKAQALKRIRHS